MSIPERSGQSVSSPTDESPWRLGKVCIYTEDAIEVPGFSKGTGLHEIDTAEGHFRYLIHPSGPLPSIDLSSPGAIRKSIISTTSEIIGSFDRIHAIATEFFTGTHQRIPALSRVRFERVLRANLAGGSICPGFAVLCLCILLVQDMPASMEHAQSPLYFMVKQMIGLLETTTEITLDSIHCKILVTFFEMGHASHTAAYTSLGSCARSGRAFGLHRKRWRLAKPDSDFEVMLNIEEEKRVWWAISIMDRFVGLCNGDAALLTDDFEREDPLPIEDLLWSEGAPKDLNTLIFAPPSLETPFDITVGQLARECQISHLVGRVSRP